MIRYRRQNQSAQVCEFQIGFKNDKRHGLEYEWKTYHAKYYGGNRVQYNSILQKTLSHYAGFPASPEMVQKNADIEENIVREIMKEN